MVMTKIDKNIYFLLKLTKNWRNDTS